MTNNPRHKSQRTEGLRGELILGRTRSGDKGCMYHCAIRMLQRVEIISIKKKVFR